MDLIKVMEDREPAKRRHGTDKTVIIGAVERGGKVVAQVAERLSGRKILEFIAIIYVGSRLSIKLCIRFSHSLHVACVLCTEAPI